jgi:hypothetical protein
MTDRYYLSHRLSNDAKCGAMWEPGLMSAQLITTSAAAKAIGVGVSTLQRWTSEGVVTPAWRTPGGQARWDLDDLRRQLKMPAGDHADASPDRPES